MALRNKIRIYAFWFFFVLSALSFLFLILNLIAGAKQLDFLLFRLSFRNTGKLIQNLLIITFIAYLADRLEFKKQLKRCRPMIVIILMALLAFIPAKILFSNYSPYNKFTSLINFGQEQFKDALPEIRGSYPAVASKWGYDGQYYAQLSADPLLRSDKLPKALDLPHYRARRIGLPFLAFLLGMGKTSRVLNVYSVLNAAFWILLLAIIIVHTGCRRYRDFLLAASMLWATGTLVSVERALTDLPAAVMGVAAVFTRSSWIAAAVLLSCAGLIKETSILSFTAVPVEPGSKHERRKRLLATLFICLLPVLAWALYVHLVFKNMAGMGGNNFNLPFFGIFMKFQSAISGLITGKAGILGHQLLFELLCPFSLLVQALYLAVCFRPDSKEWRLGVGFAFLLLFLGSDVWAEQHAYSRVLLPMTFSFNLLLHRFEKGYKYAILYILGNTGMFWAVFWHFQQA